MTFSGAVVCDDDDSFHVTIHNDARQPVDFTLDGGFKCTAQPDNGCDWSPGAGSHTLDAYLGGKHFTVSFSFDAQDLEEGSNYFLCDIDENGFNGGSCRN
jgi:hypothetical protein